MDGGGERASGGGAGAGGKESRDGGLSGFVIFSPSFGWEEAWAMGARLKPELPCGPRMSASQKVPKVQRKVVIGTWIKTND